jgi:hypothetical protein
MTLPFWTGGTTRRTGARILGTKSPLFFKPCTSMLYRGCEVEVEPFGADCAVLSLVQIFEGTSIEKT